LAAKAYNVTQLEEAYNYLKNERTTLSASLQISSKAVPKRINIKNLLDAYCV